MINCLFGMRRVRYGSIRDNTQLKHSNTLTEILAAIEDLTIELPEELASGTFTHFICPSTI